jgi:DNA-binding LacI/PurR family transcriptional regulator
MFSAMNTVPKTQAPVPAPNPAAVARTGSVAPTSADVARVAGVSRATVSYVLNDSATGRVGARTRQRVLEVAAQLGYVPNAAARSLRAGRSGIVLLDTPNIAWGPLFSEFVADLRTQLRERGYTTVVYGDEANDEPEAAVRRWAELRPTAVLFGLGLSISAQAVDLLKRSGTQAVITWGGQRTPGAHWLRTDMTAPGTVAAEHLIERGRRRIGVIVPTDPTLDYFSGPRLKGVRAAAARFARREKLAKADAPQVVRIDLDYTEEAAADLAARLPGLGLDAIFAYNDEYAMLVAASLRDAGVRIPDDVALVGADDLMLCRLLRPRLTTVRTEMPAGLRLAELIDRFVNADDGEPETVEIGTAQIVERESS